MPVVQRLLAATGSIWRLTPTNKNVLLVAWMALHGLALFVLFHIDSDLRRAQLSRGWKAATPLAALVMCNSILYARLYNYQHTRQAYGGSAFHTTAVKQDLSMFSSSLLQPAREQSPPGIRKTAATYGKAPLAALDSDVNFCKQCRVWQPAVRSHHCQGCNVCIQGFDHHCYWLGTCIGDSNHGLFWCYLLSQTVLCLYGLHHGLTAVRHAAHVPAWGLQQWLTVDYTAILAFTTLMTGLLMAFHTFLILSDWKTYELLKGHRRYYLQGRPAGARSPFDRGPVANLHNFLFNRQLYNTLVEDWHIPSHNEAAASSLWDNSWYSCC